MCLSLQMGDIGNPCFVASFLEEKVIAWRKEVEVLSGIALSQPQAAYAAFVHGLVHKWNHVFEPTLMSVLWFLLWRM